MVDIRPLLFINALCLMLLITAGFAHIKATGSLMGSEKAVNIVDNNHSNVDSPKTTMPQQRDEKIFKTPVTKPVDMPPSTASVENTTEASKVKTFSTEHKVVEVHEPAKTDTIESPNRSSTPPKLVKADKVASVVLPSKHAPTPKVKPVIKKIIKTKPVPTKGSLTIRSNVEGDTVLIDGIPHGPTKLNIKLSQGVHKIEVAKTGYNSWTSEITVIPGKHETLIAKLDKFTTVEFKNGVWVNGVVTGEGTYDDKNGTHYEGSFVKGKFHGQGTIHYSDGTRYQGDWFENKMQGDGTLTTAQGDTYTGQFKDGKFNGDGTLTKANGDIYTGTWVDGKLNGQGSLTTTKGLLYVGGFSQNEFHGQGSVTYPDGRHYEGGFNHGQFQGKGVLTFSDGKKYSGQFMEGKYHGKGELMNPNGSKITATFKFGKPFGQVRLTTPQGEVFTARTQQPGVCYREKSYRATQCPPMEGW
jgi:hypothetical protein